jgi:glycosyltransferase involved in cell wall biosynthesis
MKQARALTRAGNVVRLIGLRESADQERHIRPESGIEITRLDARGDGYRRAARAFMGKLLVFGAVASFILVAAAALLAVLAYQLFGAIFRFIGSVTIPVLAGMSEFWLALAATALFLVAGLGVSMLVVRKLAPIFGGVRRLVQLSANYAAADVKVPDWRLAVEKAIGSARPLRGITRALIDHVRLVTVYEASQAARTAAMVRECMKEPFDLAIAAEAACLPAAAKAAQLRRTRYIYDAHEFYDDLNGAAEHVTRHYKRIHKLHLKGAGLVSVVSHEMAKLYRQEYGLGELPFVLPNATPQSMIASTHSAPRSLHALMGLPRATKLILYHGGLSPGRGIETFVRAAEHLADDRAIVVLGDGKLAGWLEQERVRQAQNWAKTQVDIAVASDRERRDTLRAEARERALADLDTAARLGARTAAEKVVNSLLGLPDPSMELSEDIVSEEGSPQVDISEVARSLVECVDVLLDAKIRAMSDRPSIDDYPKLRTHPSKPQDELLSWIADAFVEVIPYPNTGLNHWVCAPNKFWEAIGAGIPIVATPLGELTRLVRDGKCGWLLPVELDPKSLAAFFNQINDDIQAEMAKGARAFREGRHFEVFAEEWVALINERIDTAAPDNRS